MPHIDIDWAINGALFGFGVTVGFCAGLACIDWAFKRLGKPVQ